MARYCTECGEPISDGNLCDECYRDGLDDGNSLDDTDECDAEECDTF